MRKGNNNRKTRRAEEQAEKKIAQMRLLGLEVVPTKDQTEPSKTPNPDREQKQKGPMVTGKFSERAKLTDVCIAFFTAVLAVVAIYQIVITGGQLGVMRNDERAWLEVKAQDGMVIHVITGEPINYAVRLSNVGKTPAKNIVWSIFVQIQDSKDEVNLECVGVPVKRQICNHNEVSAGSIFPNTHWDYTGFRPNNDFSPNVVTQSEVDAWESGKAYAAVYGIVRYDDVFGTSHWTKFCLYTPPDNKGKYFQIEKCAQYSDVDLN
jgi:hypothetical protein